MKFKEIRWKNILSYGNKLQSYKFTNKPKLVHIQGENGAGKSSIKETLTISAYGKSAIRKMKDIPNWINKTAYTFVDFETTNGDQVILERGIDPNFHRISVNGVPNNLPNKNKIDSYIETELLDFNFSIFCNTISLSFDDFKSFINLSAGDKRKIVDPMFGLDVVNDIREKIKNDIKENKKELDALNRDILKNDSLFETSNGQLKLLRSKVKDINTKEKEQISLDIETNKADMELSKSEYLSYTSSVKEDREIISEFRTKIAKSDAVIGECDKKLKIHDANKCPHCLSDLKTKGSLEIKNKIQDIKDSEAKKIIEFKQEQKDKQCILDKIVIEQEKAKAKYYSLDSTIKGLNASLAKLEVVDTSEQERSITNIIDSIKEDLKTLNSDSKEYIENAEVFSVLDDALSDNGVKKILIDKIIPTLNNRITEISNRLEFKFQFEFDNEFNPIIYYLGMEVSTEALSTGQRKKMNLIVLLSFIELIKMKYNKLNVMFLDEIFSGLDKKNVNMAVEILREYADKYNMTIFVVSHETLPEEYFDERINVTMPNHFSELEIIQNTKTLELI
tara:strand:- start:10543 stop:12231 length:1689 start_codon:yes stop_codon:yes gene_type:complete